MRPAEAAPSRSGALTRRWLAVVLAIAFAATWVWSGIDPTFRHDWYLENILVVLTVPILVWSYVRRPWSDGALALVWAFMTLHVVGSHWTYSNVPYPDWEAMGFERNHYDRVVHFAYGLLLSYPLVEFVNRRAWVPRKLAWPLVVQFILATSAIYEVIEWVTALVVDPQAGAAFLGSQGDPFDAVADMALAGAGSLLAWGVAGIVLLARRLGMKTPTRQA